MARRIESVLAVAPWLVCVGPDRRCRRLRLRRAGIANEPPINGRSTPRCTSAPTIIAGASGARSTRCCSICCDCRGSTSRTPASPCRTRAASAFTRRSVSVLSASILPSAGSTAPGATSAGGISRCASCRRRRAPVVTAPGPGPGRVAGGAARLTTARLTQLTAAGRGTRRLQPATAAGSRGRRRTAARSPGSRGPPAAPWRESRWRRHHGILAAVRKQEARLRRARRDQRWHRIAQQHARHRDDARDRWRARERDVDREHRPLRETNQRDGLAARSDRPPWRSGSGRRSARRPRPASAGSSAPAGRCRRTAAGCGDRDATRLGHRRSRAAAPRGRRTEHRGASAPARSAPDRRPARPTRAAR